METEAIQILAFSVEFVGQCIVVASIILGLAIVLGGK